MPTTTSDLKKYLTRDISRIKGLEKKIQERHGKAVEALTLEYKALLRASATRVEERRALLPKPDFTNFSHLPIHEKHEAIAKQIDEHSVVILCGETGSGKTTQIPKICLELGLGARGLIGHTQPRRLAARSVAARLATELETTLGKEVGIKIRFYDKSAPETFIKLMTDGILLAETQSDPYLNAYEVIIIDEAHERSLNIDFLLGYLKELLPHRPDLKIIITSATLDVDRFVKHFENAPLIEVSGRSYPVEIRYRPLGEDDDDADIYEAISDAVSEFKYDGDVLVFLPGEREIREAAENLRKNIPAIPPTIILPLYSRLSAAEQDSIFKTGGARRIILATNVAETSLTVPGIHYVVDTGLARIKRYSYRNKVEQLQIEKVARSAATQRAGRCGRMAAGICIRLYSEEDFNSRPEFTDPEILRTSLAGVILKMTSLHLTAIERFPFLEPPPEKAISDGYALLRELGAMTADQTLTPVGETLARLPLDPRIARMLVAAKGLDCLPEVLIIAAALSVPDPRERPYEKQEAAAEKHRLFFDPQSEFLIYLKIWQWFQKAENEKKSRRQLLDNIHSHFLSYMRLREWREIHAQLVAILNESGMTEISIEKSIILPFTKEKYAAIHQALLSGLLGNIGCKSDESGYYLGARGIRFLVHPASPLQKKSGKWIMSAEITETSRLFARGIAHIESTWIEKVGAHLIKSQYLDPHWEKKAMQVVAWERITLYGVVIEAKRRIHYGPIDQKLSRDIFIRQALVGEDVNEIYAKAWGFFHHNQNQIRAIEKLEHKQRRQDVLVDDELIYAFYDQIIPENIHNAITFDHWRKGAEKENPRLLYLSRDDLMRHEAAGITTENFPAEIILNGIAYKLDYHFEPGSIKDGVTLTLPIAQLNQLPAAHIEWLVPGLIKEKIIALLKSLPQRLRAKLVPIPDFAEDFLVFVKNNDRDTSLGILPALMRYLKAEKDFHARGWEISADAFRPETLSAHFFMAIRLVDDNARQLDMSRRLQDLRQDWESQAKTAFSAQINKPAAFSEITDWSFCEIAELMEIALGEQRLMGYPALCDEESHVSLNVFDSPEEARKIHSHGLLRLFMIQLKDQHKYFDKNIPDIARLGMFFMPFGTLDELKKQIISLSFSRACLFDPLPNNLVSFENRIRDAKARLGLIFQEICRLVFDILNEYQSVQKKLTGLRSFSEAYADINLQIKNLLYKNFILETPFEKLKNFPRYLKAILTRLDKLKANSARDTALLKDYAPLWQNYARQNENHQKRGIDDPALVQFRWLLEELRVSLFAQELKTPVPVSIKRLQKAWSDIGRV